MTQQQGATSSRTSRLIEQLGQFVRRLRELSQPRAIVVRVVIVVAGALLVKAIADETGQPLAYVATAGFAVVVLVAFHLVHIEKDGKSGWGYALYIVTAAVGVALYAWKGLAADIGMSSPVAWYASLALLFTGLTGITKRARRSERALTRGALVLAVAVVAAWFGLRRWESGEPLLAVAALVLLYVGLTLLSGGLVTRESARQAGGSNRYLAAAVLPLQPRRTWLLASGLTVLAAAIVGAGALMVREHDLDAGAVFWGTCIMLAFLLLVVSDNVTDTAALLSVALLVFSLSAGSVPYDTGSPAVAPIAPGDTTLIALGDSFISGEGAETFYAETNVRGQNECRRAPTAYAPRLLDDAEFRPQVPFDSLIFLACSGAKARHLYYAPQYPNDPIGGPPRLRANGLFESGAAQLEQLDQRLRADRPERGMVLLSLGGNDAGFGTIIMSCIGLGSCAPVVDRWTDELADIKPGLRAAFEDLRSIVGANVPVLVVPYPIPLAPKRCDESVLTSAEHAKLHGFVVALNDTVAQVATESGIGFTVLDRAGDDDSAFQRLFDDRRVCDSGAGAQAVNYVGVNPIAGAVRERANPRNWLHNSFHPNEMGHEIIAREVRDWIDEQGDRTSWSFDLPDEPYRPRPDLAAREMQLEQRDIAAVESTVKAAGDDDGSCPVSGPDWEGAWAACENARVAQRYYPWALGAIALAFAFVLTLIVLARETWNPITPPMVAGAEAAPE